MPFCRWKLVFFWADPEQNMSFFSAGSEQNLSFSHPGRNKTWAFFGRVGTKYDWIGKIWAFLGWDRTAVLTWQRKAEILFHAVLFCSYPAEKKLKFCSYPAEKSSSFVLTWPKTTHILFRLRVLGWKKMINHLIMTQSNPPYRFLRSLDCPFKY